MPDNPNATATPQVNDAYWFQFSKDLKDSAYKRRDEAAAKLQTLVTWRLKKIAETFRDSQIQDAVPRRDGR